MTTIVTLIALLILVTLISLPMVLILLRSSRRRKLSAKIRQPVHRQSAPVLQRPDPRSPYARIPHLLTAQRAGIRPAIDHFGHHKPFLIDHTLIDHAPAKRFVEATPRRVGS